MIQLLPENESPTKAVPVAEIAMSAYANRVPAKIIRPGMVVIRLAGDNLLDIRHLTLLANNRVPDKPLIARTVSRGQTAMMMVILPWRELGISGLIA